MQGSLPPDAEEKLEKLQSLQTTARQLATQKEQSERALTESKTALAALEELDPETEMYRSVGSLLVETDYGTAEEDLGEKGESLQIRVDQLERQEERIRDQFESLQEDLQQLLGGLGGGPSVGGS
ncbi:UNVERIFIED_CONTAM: prefoldin subunit beta [Euhalothece sp. KZN 001]